MALEKVGTFILTDETLDAHSERVIARGVDLTRFKQNPVMLFNHIRSVPGFWDEGALSNDSILPIGRWENIKKVNDQITADAMIDMGDDFASKIGQKVKDGIINAVSIGFKALAYSDDPNDKVQGQKGLTITKAELLEASLVDIPANPNALIISKHIASKQKNGEQVDASNLLFVKSFSRQAGKTENIMENKNLFDTVKANIKKWFGKDVSTEEEAIQVMETAEEIPGQSINPDQINEVVEQKIGDIDQMIKKAVTAATTAQDEIISGLIDQVAALAEKVATIGEVQEEVETAKAETSKAAESLARLSQTVAGIKAGRSGGQPPVESVAAQTTTGDPVKPEEAEKAAAKTSLTDSLAKARKNTFRLN